MFATALASALSAVDWNNNVKVFLATPTLPEKVAQAHLRLAQWARQFETVDAGNPALSFVREMQAAGHNTAALIAVALYKPSAGAMRTVYESALYYTYFRTHPSELATLATNPEFFLDRQDLVSYHKQHSRKFVQLQNLFDLTNRMKQWYSRVSAIVHGQIPGAWSKSVALKDVKHDSGLLSQSVDMFIEGEELVHQLLLCTVGQALWDSFSKPAKKMFLTGLAPGIQSSLGYDQG